MRKFDYKNNYTKKIHEKLIKTDKGEYQKYLYNTFSEYFDGGNNEILNNAKISFDCFQAIEVYSRTNKKKVEKIFSKLVKLCRNNVYKYSNLRNVANENIYKIIDRTDHSYIAKLIEFKINCELKYISYINLTLDCIGPNLFKFIFNCELTDFAKYKYWLYACPNVLTELEIKRELALGKINISKITGNQRKRSMLKKHTHNIYNEINRYIASIAPGIFTNIYKKIPCTMSAVYDIQNEYIITESYVIYNELKRTNFFNNIHTFNRQNDRYINNDNGNTFIPIKYDIMPDDDILMMYYRTNNLLPSDMAWINIVYFLLHEQKNLIEMLKNEHYENDIYGKTIKIKDYKNKMRKIEPLLSLIKTSFNPDKFSFKDYYNTYNDYVMSFDDENKIYFYNEYKERIDYLLREIDKEVISIKEIYSSNYTEINTKLSRRLQWIAIFMALITVLQAFSQCQETKYVQKRSIEDIPKIENEAVDDYFLNIIKR